MTPSYFLWTLRFSPKVGLWDNLFQFILVLDKNIGSWKEKFSKVIQPSNTGESTETLSFYSTDFHVQDNSKLWGGDLLHFIIGDKSFCLNIPQELLGAKNQCWRVMCPSSFCIHYSKNQSQDFLRQVLHFLICIKEEQMDSLVNIRLFKTSKQNRKHFNLAPNQKKLIDWCSYLLF